jgi:hypothetical protein
MDPKTDSGMIPDDEIVLDDTNIHSLLPEEVVWIMDQLLAREVRPPLDTVDVDLMAFGKSVGADVVYVYLFSGFIVEFQRYSGECYVC